MVPRRALNGWGAAASLGGVTNSKLVSALSLVFDHVDHSGNKHASNLMGKHSGFGSEQESQCGGSKPEAMLICVLP